MIRQDFDVGDLVEVSRDMINPPLRGIITQSQLINSMMASDLKNSKWHRDEYHCKVRTLGGDSRWVRAKWLTIISKAEEINS